MPSALDAFRVALGALWVGTSPPSSADTGDASGIPYTIVDDLDEERTPGRHRQITFGRTLQRRYIQEPTQGQGSGQAESLLEAFLSLARDPVSGERTDAAFVRAIDAEVELLGHVFAAAADLGAGVIEAHLDEAVDDTASVQPPKARSGNARAAIGGVSRTRFTFRVLHGV